MVISLNQAWVSGAENLLIVLCQSHLAGTRDILSPAAACLTHTPQGWCSVSHAGRGATAQCWPSPRWSLLTSLCNTLHRLLRTRLPRSAPSLHPQTRLLADVSKKPEIFGRTSVGSDFPPELDVTILTLSQVNLYFNNDVCGRLWYCLLSVYVQLPPRK